MTETRATAIRSAISAYWAQRCPTRRLFLADVIYTSVPQEHITVCDTRKPQLLLCHLPEPVLLNPTATKLRKAVPAKLVKQ